ncbi:5-(carboxyamino)imidazole ribonucleotide mutase [Syntrophorhabdus aromaticivorans]|uniref:N5-carboxyaminoimidazole ribonucleotide mutase n=1 Tax=Syntrophorhabdus aromaticivorans TaxID=328301 RepID=A0A971M3Q1_9BACT|nr:5-(carboxyamino)imidazole ribonucleotide mutase [Syntrophorhabdus aromaticivorans]NLW35320.1 5-(carboxyamino)imidazole ribonucleotide mutase [Syntrophorhabdus aromaticivorans]
MEKPKILILIGSDSDLPVIDDGLKFLKDVGVPFALDISSAHRQPDKTVQYAKKAREEGIEVIIAVAGMAAHLPGVLASHTTIPVIGVPTSGGVLNGVDALLSIVQMPKGIPVATVGIDASRNAAILACKILSIKHDEIRQKLEKIKMDMQRRNDEKSLKLNRYLED